MFYSFSDAFIESIFDSVLVSRILLVKTQVVVICHWCHFQNSLIPSQNVLMPKNTWLCFRMSSSFVGNNPSLQINSFNEDRGKYNKIGNPSISDFSTILTSDILILAENSHLLVPSDEAYRQCLSLPCYRLSTPCYECKPNTRHFFDKIFIKA